MTVATRSTTRVGTYVHTTIHLAGLIVSGAQELLLALGIRPGRLISSHDTYERAFRTWLEERSLQTVRFECYKPSGTLFGFFEFDVVYSAADGSARFVDSQPRVRRAYDQFGRAPAGSWFEVICTFRYAHTDIDGWTPLYRPLARGSDSRHFGTYGSGPGATVGLRFTSA